MALILAAAFSTAFLSGCSTAPTGINTVTNPVTGSTTAKAGSTTAATTGRAGTTATVLNAVQSITVDYDADDLDASVNSAASTLVTLNGNSITVTGTGATVSGSKVTLSAAGTYLISGTLNDGQIIVDTQDKGVVRLVLNNAAMTSKNSSPIQVISAKKVVLVLADGTMNTVTDGSTYTNVDAATNEPNAAIFSKADLTINGKGSLTVDANYAHGIVSKDDLKIVSGTIKVESVNDGLKGKDIVAIRDGTVTINAGGDGIQSTNSEEEAKGNVAIDGGTITITSGLDGVQAEKTVQVANGTLNIIAGGGSSKGVQQSGGTVMGGRPGQTTTTTTAANTADSKKGIKGLANVIINNGTIAINSADDTIHSNGNITINGGSLTLTSGDDGIHADTSIVINAGDVNIKKSYEGIESASVKINGGNVRVAASDDGINIAGGADGSSMGGRPGQNTFTASSTTSLTISGGTITVDANGDGVDSNGTISMSDGVLLVNGPTNNGNGALDFNSFTMTGGFLVAAGSSGMAQAPDSPSTQYSLIANFTSSLQAGTLVNISSSTGEEIATFAPTKTFQSIVVSSTELKQGSSYIVSTGGSSTGTVTDSLYSGGAYQAGTQVTTMKISSILTRYGSASGGPGGQAGPGGGKR